MTTRRRAALVAVASLFAASLALIVLDEPAAAPESAAVVTTTTDPPSTDDHVHAMALAQTKRGLVTTTTTIAPPPPTTVTPPETTATRVPSSGPDPVPVVSGDRFDALAQCESGGDPTTNTGNGYYGAFQFDLQTWRSTGRSGSPTDYSYGEQKAAAMDLHAVRGWHPWPGCARKLGYL